MTLAARFWPFVDHSRGCWLWQGTRGSHQYGQIWNGWGPELAHRVSYRLNKGPVPKRLHVLHSCDNPGCVRPGHLFLGTAKENAMDREQKNRGNHARGERQGSARLTVEDVYTIRKSTDGPRALGRKYGVAHTTIMNVLRNRSWSHI